MHGQTSWERRQGSKDRQSQARHISILYMEVSPHVARVHANCKSGVRLAAPRMCQNPTLAPVSQEALATSISVEGNGWSMGVLIVSAFHASPDADACPFDELAWSRDAGRGSDKVRGGTGPRHDSRADVGARVAHTLGTQLPQ